MGDNIKPTLAIMAAGQGQRYGGPKQIDPVNGHILLEYSIYDALREGFGKVLVLIREDLKGDFMEKYGQRIQKGVDMWDADFDCVCQKSLAEVRKTLPFRKKMWGTGYAALCFKDEVKEPFAAINADNFYGKKPFEVLYEFFNDPSYDPNGDVHTLVGHRLKNVVHSKKPVAEAICAISSEGFLESIVERTEIMRKGGTFVFCEDKKEFPLDPDTIVSATFWGFNPTIFPKLKNGFEKFLEGIKLNKEPKKEFYIPDLVGELITKDEIKVKILPTEEQCFGMTYKKQHSRVAKTIKELTAKGLYPDELWKDKN